MALEVDDACVRLFGLELGLALLLRAEHGGHGCPRVAGVRAVAASAAVFAQTGWLGFSRRRATRHSVKMGVVRRARDGWARGAAPSGPLMERKFGAPRGASSYLRPRPADGAAHELALLALIAAAWRREVRSHVAGAATDNLQT